MSDYATLRCFWHEYLTSEFQPISVDSVPMIPFPIYQYYRYRYCFQFYHFDSFLRKKNENKNGRGFLRLFSSLRRCPNQGFKFWNCYVCRGHRNYRNFRNIGNFEFFWLKLFEILTDIEWIWIKYDQIHKKKCKKPKNSGEIWACRWWGGVKNFEKFETKFQTLVQIKHPSIFLTCQKSQIVSGIFIRLTRSNQARVPKKHSKLRFKITSLRGRIYLLGRVSRSNQLRAYDPCRPHILKTLYPLIVVIGYQNKV